ncbi:MAG: hypothetical protein HRU30_21475 [Rhodobacteraceae bacterium]|nr:hypothetical protein [Paracoccaceae bacterium]
MTVELHKTSNVQSVLHAGLAFHMPGETFDTASTAAHLSLLLADIGFENWPLPNDNPMLAVLSCNDCTVFIEIERDGDFNWLNLSLETSAPDITEAVAEGWLAQIVHAVLKTMTPETVAWLQPDALISPWEFQAMLAEEPAEEAPAAIVNLRPFELSLRDPAQCTCNEGAKKRRIKVPAPANAAVAHAIRHEPTREELADEFGDDAVPETEMRRLSVWLMTFALGIVALPAALALGVVSLFKGEDFRFATQVIALTVLAMSLETSGALAAILY